MIPAGCEEGQDASLLAAALRTVGWGVLKQCHCVQPVVFA